MTLRQCEPDTQLTPFDEVFRQHAALLICQLLVEAKSRREALRLRGRYYGVSDQQFLYLVNRSHPRHATGA